MLVIVVLVLVVALLLGARAGSQLSTGHDAQDAASTVSFARGAEREEGEAAEPSMDWVLAGSGDPEGCRRVQAYLGRTSQQNLRAIQQAFRSHIEELYKCPNANHVLARLIVSRRRRTRLSSAPRSRGVCRRSPNTSMEAVSWRGCSNTAGALAPPMPSWAESWRIPSPGAGTGTGITWYST